MSASRSAPEISFSIVGFDLDGTLLDTSGDLAAAVNYALGEDGRRTLAADEVVTMIGAGARHLLAQALAATGNCRDDEFDVHYRRMLDHYEAHIADHTLPYPGAIAAVDRLRAQGVRPAVVTNKAERFTRKLLGLLDLADRFDCVIGGDTLGEGNAKPSPAPIREMVARCGGGSAVFVGDSIYDIEATHAAGLSAVAVSFGFHQQPVETLGAEAVIDHFDELVPTLAHLRQFA